MRNPSRRDLLKLVPAVTLTPTAQITNQQLIVPTTPLPDINQIPLDSIPLDQMIKFLFNVNRSYPNVYAGKNEMFAALSCKTCGSKRKKLINLPDVIEHLNEDYYDWSVDIDEDGNFKIDTNNQLPFDYEYMEEFVEDENFMLNFAALFLFNKRLQRTCDLQIHGYLMLPPVHQTSYTSSEDPGLIVCPECLQDPDNQECLFTPGYEIDFSIASDHGKIYRPTLFDEIGQTMTIHELKHFRRVFNKQTQREDVFFYVSARYNQETRQFEPVAHLGRNDDQIVPLHDIVVVQEK